MLARTRDAAVGECAVLLERWPDSLSRDLVTKAAVPPATSVDQPWAGALVVAVPELVAAFVTLARSASLLARIPKLRKQPFHTPVPVEAQGANYHWVQQGAPKPVSRFTFESIRLERRKAVGIIVVTDELLTLSAAGTDVALRDLLVAGVTQFTDRQFVDPAVAEVANVNPASITNGTTAIASTGDLATDVGTLVDSFFADRPGADDAVLLMTSGTKAQLVGTNGGSSVFGLPTVVSGALQGLVVILDPRGVVVADDGVDVETTRDASVELTDAPTAPTAATTLVPLWQYNLAGIKVERFVNWQAVPTAVKYLVAA